MNELSKSQWGPGPWQEEPDEVRWTDKATGLSCLILRGPVGSLCGYVGVRPTHPAYELDYTGITGEDAKEKCSRWGKALRLWDKKGLDSLPELPEYDKVPGIGEQLEKVEVHGGLTFAGRWGKDTNTWWFGFDCAHSGDLAPGMKAITKMLRKQGIMPPRPAFLERFKEIYRDLNYVRAECADLARQLREMEVCYAIDTSNQSGDV